MLLVLQTDNNLSTLQVTLLKLLRDKSLFSVFTSRHGKITNETNCTTFWCYKFSTRTPNVTWSLTTHWFDIWHQSDKKKNKNIFVLFAAWWLSVFVVNVNTVHLELSKLTSRNSESGLWCRNCKILHCPVSVINLRCVNKAVRERKRDKQDRAALVFAMSHEPSREQASYIFVFCEKWKAFWNKIRMLLWWMVKVCSESTMPMFPVK